MDLQAPPVVIQPIADGSKLIFSGPIHVNVAWLERELKKVTDAHPKLVEIDLAATEYISSLGLGLIVGFRNGIVRNGGVVKVVKIQKRTLAVFRIARLDRMLNIDPSAVIEPAAP